MNKKSKIKSIIFIIFLLIIVLDIIIFILTGNEIITSSKKYLKKQEKLEINKTEATYEVVNDNGEEFDIVILIQNQLGIKNVKCPNGLELNANGKSNISIDYKIKQNQQYQFIISTKDNEETLILDSTNTNKIEIQEQSSQDYPIITDTGIKEPKKVINIQYNQEGKNYYSLDEGQTWNEYKNELDIYNNKLIKAKTIKDGYISQIVSKNIEINIPKDALSYKAYDGNVDTNDYMGSKSERKILVDSSMYNKSIYLTAQENSLSAGSTGKPNGYTCYLSAFLKDGTQNILYVTPKQNASYTRKEIIIPESTEYLLFNTGAQPPVRWSIEELEL